MIVDQQSKKGNGHDQNNEDTIVTWADYIMGLKTWLDETYFLLGCKSETLCQFIKARENIFVDSFDNMRAQTKLKWLPLKKSSIDHELFSKNESAWI